MSSVTGLVVMGIFATACGGLVFWRESRRGSRQQAVWFLVGIAGLYVCTCAAIEHVGWLYIPGLAVLAASYIGQFLTSRRSRRTAAEYGNGTDKP